MKRTYAINNASIQEAWQGGQYLRGQITDHPNCPPGGVAHTSLIVMLDGHHVETENSFYIVESWDAAPDAPPVS